MNKFTAVLVSAALLTPGIAIANHGEHWSVHHAGKYERKSKHHQHKAKQHYEKVRYHARLAHPNTRHAHGVAARETVYGRVLQVQPVYAGHGYRQGEYSCVQWSDDYDHRHSAWVPTVVGGVLGGAIGYHLGEDHDKPELGTIAGGLLGAAAGHGVGQKIYDSRHIRVSGPCRPQSHDRNRSELVEYLVVYRYNGRIYREHLDYNPGQWVRLNVEASPG